MTVYHTATQEDYDALMVELEEQGFSWCDSRELPTNRNLWEKNLDKTCIHADSNDMYLTYSTKSYFDNYFKRNKDNYGEVIEYKAKKKPELPEWARWIARDKDGELDVFENEPVKQLGIEAWNHGGYYEDIDDPSDYYEFIKWEDDEPTSVGDLRMKLANVKTVAEYAEPNTINKPSHYIGINGIDVIGFAEAQFSKEEQKGFHRINAIKYITRYDRKNGVEDLNKAKFYIDKLIEMEEQPHE